MALSILVCTACVKKADYDLCVADAAKTRADAAAKDKADAAAIARLRAESAAAEAATQDRDAKLSDLSTEQHNLRAQLDEATAMNAQLRAELSRLGKDVDKILQERGTMAKALDEAKARLEELRKAQAAAEARTELFRDFERRFKALVDAGQMRIETRRGRLVMEVSGDLLFDANRTEVRVAGRGALMEIARAVETTSPPSSGRRFVVTAHLDDAKVSSRRYKTPWDLTAARAVAVVQYLVSLGVAAESLTAAGAGSYDPIAPNDSDGARARNRRIEVALQPGAAETLSAAGAAR